MFNVMPFIYVCYHIFYCLSSCILIHLLLIFVDWVIFSFISFISPSLIFADWIVQHCSAHLRDTSILANPAPDRQQQAMLSDHRHTHL